MNKPYGKLPKRAARKSLKSEKSGESSALKIKLRGKDGAPLSMKELQQGLYDVMRELKPYAGMRVKWATVYLTLIDENGKEVLVEPKEREIYPYESAADEHGV